MTESAAILSGARAIGRALGMSERTVRRKHLKREIPTFQIGSRTSPLKILRKSIAEIRREFNTER